MDSGAAPSSCEDEEDDDDDDDVAESFPYERDSETSAGAMQKSISFTLPRPGTEEA
jgi:hypothetical protein